MEFPASGLLLALENAGLRFAMQKMNVDWLVSCFNGLRFLIGLWFRTWRQEKYSTFLSRCHRLRRKLWIHGYRHRYSTSTLPQ